MTTPEQLAKWREEFESKLKGDDRMSYCSTSRPFVNKSIQSEWQGYLRAKQETEKAIKDARKQALEESIEIADAWAMEYVIEDNATLTVGDYIKQELLND